MTKKTNINHRQIFGVLQPGGKKEIRQRIENLALSEMFLAAFARNSISAHKLAHLAAVSPGILEEFNGGSQGKHTLHSAFKGVHGLEFSLLLEKDGQTIFRRS